NKADTTTALNSSANPSAVGQAVTFTASVTVTAPGAGTPSGTVTFQGGAARRGGGTLNGAGQATFSTTTLPAGTHAITAFYAGETNFNGRTSGTVSQVVNVTKADTTTALSSSANPSAVGQAVTFTASVTVTAPGAGTPSGTVTFQ